MGLCAGALIYKMEPETEQNSHHGLRCITRGERNQRPYWRVAVRRRGVLYQKRFLDHLYPSREQALLAAQQWRDQIQAEHPVFDKLHLSQTLRVNNTSGYPGVFLRTITRVRNGKVQNYRLWQAQTPEGVKPFKSKSFSILKYGDAEAYALALAARHEFEAALQRDLIP